MEHMDEQVVDLMRDQFKALSDKIDVVHDVMQGHINKDEKYWEKVDQMRGQVSVWKMLTVPGLSGFFAWLYSAFKH